MAFPTTSVLDTLTGGSSLGGNWTTPTWGYPNGATEAAGVGASANQGAAYWNPATFGPDAEAYVTLATIPGGANYTALGIRMTNNGTSSAPSLDGYWMWATPSGSWTLYKLVNNNWPGTSILTGTQAFTSGDSIGLSAVGTTLTMKYKAAAGSWATVSSVTDATWTGAGNIGFLCDVAAGKLTNFGGGTIVSAPTNSVAPTVSGLTPIGSTLSESDGTWTGSPTFTYQWTRDGSNIASATSSTYVTVTADGSHAVGVKVTGTNAGGALTVASSNTISVAAPAALGASYRVLKRRR